MLSFRSLSIHLAISTCRSMSTSSKIAVAQLCSSSSKLDNLVHVAKCAGLANREVCSMLFLPECFGFIGESSAQTLGQAEPPIQQDRIENDSAITETLKTIVSDPEETRSLHYPKTTGRISIMDGLRQIAKASKLWISAGGMHVSGAPPDSSLGTDRVFNTHVIVDDEGEVQSSYRKIHLFDVSIPGKVNLRESATTAAGEDLVVCNSPIGKLGLSTCYDVRFPEMYLKLVELGAEFLLIPSAFTVPTGSAHWHVLLRARAIESQCYVIAAAQFGQHNEKRQSYGHSLVVDPWGKVLVDAGGFDSDASVTLQPPTIVICETDRAQISAVRERMPIQMHRAKADSCLRDRPSTSSP